MNKKFLQLLLITITAGTVFSSCSKDEEITGNGSNEITQIQLTSSISQTLTRSTVQNTQIESGQKVGFMVTDDPYTSVLYDNIMLTADGSGNFAYASPMYYPTNGGKVSFVAYHPYNAAITGIGTPYAFKVEADQSVRANYLNSDVLYGSTASVERTKDAVALQFKHAFSKLTFTVKKGNGATLAGLSSIEVLGLKDQADVNFALGTVLANGTATTIKAFNVPNGTASDTELTGAAAIVVPQVIASGQSLLRITIGGIPYLYAPSASSELKKGTAYNYTITVNMAGITVTSSIVDWENGGNIDGEGEIA